MKKKSSKTSKPEATKKAKTGRTKGKRSPTLSKRVTSPTLYVTTHVSNLKGTFLTATEGSLSLSGEATPTSTLEFYLLETTQFGKGVERIIRIGLNGLEYRGPSDDGYRTIGWDELEEVDLSTGGWTLYD